MRFYVYSFSWPISFLVVKLFSTKSLSSVTLAAISTTLTYKSFSSLTQRASRASTTCGSIALRPVVSLTLLSILVSIYFAWSFTNCSLTLSLSFTLQSLICHSVFDSTSFNFSYNRFWASITASAWLRLSRDCDFFS